jgi:hypothetical protein
MTRYVSVNPTHSAVETKVPYGYPATDAPLNEVVPSNLRIGVDDGTWVSERDGLAGNEVRKLDLRLKIVHLLMRDG